MKLKREMIFIQPLCDNFLSHTHIIILFSLFLFLSPLFLTNEKREKEIVTKSCIKWLFKYHYSTKKHKQQIFTLRTPTK